MRTPRWASADHPLLGIAARTTTSAMACFFSGCPTQLNTDFSKVLSVPSMCLGDFHGQLFQRFLEIVRAEETVIVDLESDLVTVYLFQNEWA